MSEEDFDWRYYDPDQNPDDGFYIDYSSEEEEEVSEPEYSFPEYSIKSVIPRGQLDAPLGIDIYLDDNDDYDKLCQFTQEVYQELLDIASSVFIREFVTSNTDIPASTRARAVSSRHKEVDAAVSLKLASAYSDLLEFAVCRQMYVSNIHAGHEDPEDPYTLVSDRLIASHMMELLDRITDSDIERYEDYEGSSLMFLRRSLAAFREYMAEEDPIEVMPDIRVFADQIGDDLSLYDSEKLNESFNEFAVFSSEVSAAKLMIFFGTEDSDMVKWKPDPSKINCSYLISIARIVEPASRQAFIEYEIQAATERYKLLKSETPPPGFEIVDGTWFGLLVAFGFFRQSQ